MGMITRVRARLQSLSISSTNTKLDPKQVKEERNAKMMCILSAILLVPCFARLPSPFLIGCVGFAYILVVLPMLLSGGSLYRCIQMAETYLIVARGVLNRSLIQMRVVCHSFLRIKNDVECGFLKMGNLSTILNQMIFFTMCDRFFCPNERLTCLYSLMFYNVIAYCVAYVQQLVSKEDWSPYIRISKTTNVKHLAMTTTNIVLELTKAITFIITVVFMLLVFGLEQGLENYHPTWAYIVVTGFYYMLTEKTFSQNCHNFLELLDLELLEGLEKLWAPVIIKGCICFLCGLMSVPLFLLGYFRFAFFALYFNVYLSYKEMMMSGWAALKLECAALAKFRYATNQEVKDVDDVCAVCLHPMRFARITPCHHMFHGDCLRLCLKENTSCPMCKQGI